jgi:oligopeptide transport system substrate-binding protein
MSIRATFAAAALSIASLASTFIAPSSSAWAQSIFHRGNDSDPETLDAHKTQTSSEAHLLRDLSEGLVIHDMLGNVVPGVAESWTISPDGKVYTFKLRANAKWSNGDAVTAADFVYSLRRILTPATGAKYANILYPILNGEKINKSQGLAPEQLGVKALDPLTLEIALERPTPFFLELLTHQTGLPVHPASVEKHGKDFVKPENWVSNGAYRLTSYTPNAVIKLAKNANFHAASTVKIDEVHYYPIQDLAAATRRFIAGELHFTSDLPADQVKDLKARLGNQVSIAPYLGTYYLAVNTSKAPFSDARVRRALALAIDREYIASQIWSDTMIPAYAFVPPGVNNYREPAYVASRNQSVIDREDEAKKLLAEAGFTAAKPLKLTLRFNMTDNNKATVVALADQWKQIGVETAFVSTDGKTHFAHLRERGDYDIARVGWIADYSDAQNFLFLLQSDNAGLNYARFNNKAFDDLMRKAESETDLKKRADILFEAEKLIMSELPLIPLFYYSTKNLVSTKLKGFKANARGAFATRFMELTP